MNCRGTTLPSYPWIDAPLPTQFQDPALLMKLSAAFAQASNQMTASSLSTAAVTFPTTAFVGTTAESGTASVTFFSGVVTPQTSSGERLGP